MPDPYEMYDVLKRRAESERARKTLEAIQAVCEEQFERGSRDFSIAMISKLGEKKGVPKSQSIRNETGEIYRELIKAWRENYPKPLTRVNKTKKFDWVDSIQDRSVKWSVEELALKNKELIAEITLLKQVTNLKLDLRPQKASVSSSTALPEFLGQELEALSASIDEEYLSQFGLSAGKAGSIVDSKGRTVFKAGFVSAIRKSLSVNKKGRPNG